jgi:hypothetical protein
MGSIALRSAAIRHCCGVRQLVAANRAEQLIDHIPRQDVVDVWIAAALFGGALH